MRRKGAGFVNPLKDFLQRPDRFAHVEEDKAELAGFVRDGEQQSVPRPALSTTA